jgi:hypothetical protein
MYPPRERAYHHQSGASGYAAGPGEAEQQAEPNNGVKKAGHLGPVASEVWPLMRCSGSTCDYPEDNRGKQDGAMKYELIRMIDFEPKGTKELDKHLSLSAEVYPKAGDCGQRRGNEDGR